MYTSTVTFDTVASVTAEDYRLQIKHCVCSPDPGDPPAKDIVWYVLQLRLPKKSGGGRVILALSDYPDDIQRRAGAFLAATSATPRMPKALDI